MADSNKGCKNGGLPTHNVLHVYKMNLAKKRINGKSSHSFGKRLNRSIVRCVNDCRLQVNCFLPKTLTQKSQVINVYIKLSVAISSGSTSHTTVEYKGPQEENG